MQKKHIHIGISLLTFLAGTAVVIYFLQSDKSATGAIKANPIPDKQPVKDAVKQQPLPNTTEPVVTDVTVPITEKYLTDIIQPPDADLNRQLDEAIDALKSKTNSSLINMGLDYIKGNQQIRSAIIDQAKQSKGKIEDALKNYAQKVTGFNI